MSMSYLLTISETLNYTAEQLKDSSPSPYLDSEILLEYVTRRTREYFYTHPEKKLTKHNLIKLLKLIARRKNHEPIAYIIGSKEFYGLKFKINKNVLIPRPETELMVEETITLINSLRTPILFLDVGTGSGCIPISIIKNIRKKDISFYAIEVSKKAAGIAKKNSKFHGVSNKLKILRGDLLTPAANIINNKILAEKKLTLIITANLPYLSPSIYKNTSPDIKFYEPKAALLGGNNGLKYYRRLFIMVKKFPRKKTLPTYVLCEIDPSQKKLMKTLALKYFPRAKIEIKQDLAGLYRLSILTVGN